MSARPQTLFALAAAALFPAEAAAQQGYQKPPAAVLELLQAETLPQASVSSTGDRMLLLRSERYPGIGELAQPMLRLAGVRISPATYGPHRPPRLVGLTLIDLKTNKRLVVKAPENPHLGRVSWSPDGRRFAFTHATPTAIELWVGDARSGEAAPVKGLRLNAVLGAPYDWMPDGRLLCTAVPEGRPKPPEAPRAPKGPTVQESAGKPAPVRTYQDLLQNAHDVELFDYYATAQQVIHDPSTGRTTPGGKAAVFSSVTPSPDGKHLLVSYLRRPYSYLHPYPSFPKEIEVWDLGGKVLHKVASLPLADRVPIEGVRAGPRQVHWHPTEPATLVWAEALDGGDPRKQVPHRDRVVIHRAPFSGQPSELFKTEHRNTSVAWGEKGGMGLVREYDRKRRWERTHLVHIDKPGEGRVVWDRSVQDRYKDPGTPMARTLPNGHRAIRQHTGGIFLSGAGATPQGDRPFIDVMDLKTLETRRLFRSGEKEYEAPVALLAEDGSRFLTRHESPADPPNYFARDAKGQKQALTEFKDPTPLLRQVTRQLVTYKRADGVPLSMTLYLPPNYKKGERLPAVLWAYPREYNDADTAGQITGSPHRFTTVAGPSHLFFLTQGYAVLDGATMPVVGDPETVNNTFLKQVVDSAKAAIDKADAMGVIDPKRVGVGGHSYGAFMTANLLANSDLFKAGIARSGAYNRTLTPFGFQSERRTFWEAPEMYFKVSPFMHADKIKRPILLIHGEADNNSGTFPIQSERLYHAVKGNGGTARYVTLPHESHGYAARESVEHVLWEMLTWFDRHVKHAK